LRRLHIVEHDAARPPIDGQQQAREEQPTEFASHG
jgi:hypothetical protein